MRETAKQFASAFAPPAPATATKPDTAFAEISTDPSYLPELKSYLQQLLADAERLHAASDLQPWARAHAAPPSEQISQVRELIRRIEADLDTLTDQDRARIHNAVTTIRATRQAVTLGMPAIRPATPSG
ncbi:MAG TPA: hypothetical protein VK280_17215 [Streptosporangiaceae bacterium]|nr:hypothetical protein [Streptosporangiaceae bacterium]